MGYCTGVRCRPPLTHGNARTVCLFALGSRSELAALSFSGELAFFLLPLSHSPLYFFSSHFKQASHGEGWSRPTTSTRPTQCADALFRTDSVTWHSCGIDCVTSKCTHSISANESIAPFPGVRFVETMPPAFGSSTNFCGVIFRRSVFFFFVRLPRGSDPRVAVLVCHYSRVSTQTSDATLQVCRNWVVWKGATYDLNELQNGHGPLAEQRSYHTFNFTTHVESWKRSTRCGIRQAGVVSLPAYDNSVTRVTQTQHHREPGGRGSGAGPIASPSARRLTRRAMDSRFGGSLRVDESRRLRRGESAGYACGRAVGGAKRSNQTRKRPTAPKRTR